MSHYVAQISVKRVDMKPEEVPVSGIRGGSGPKTTREKRVVTDLANVTVKSDTVEEAIRKAKAHLDLVEDIKDTDENRAGLR